MNELGSTLALLSGAMLVKLRVSDGYQVYVKPSMGIWILLAGVLLLILGAAGLAQLFRPLPSGDATYGDGHAHGAPKVAALLVVPILAVFLVDPAPLGSYAAGRQQMRVPERPSGNLTEESPYPPLPPARDGAVDMSVSDYVSRALYDPERALGDARLRLVGIVTTADPPATFRLTRFKLACCAADAYPVQLDIVDAGEAPPTDTWVEVEGTFVEGAFRGRVPRLRALSVRPVPQPGEPYE